MNRWISDRLGLNVLLRDEWLASRQALTTRERRRLSARRVMSIAYEIVREVIFLPISLPRGVIHLISLARELERLHFGPLRRVMRGRHCVVDRQSWLINGQNIVLGDNVKISAFSAVMAGNTATIEIGDNTIIGPGVVIVAFNHGTRDADIPIRFQQWEESKEHSVYIGPNVWIGAGVMVLPGTSIQEGAIIGAGTLVRGHVPPGTTLVQKRENVSIKAR